MTVKLTAFKEENLDELSRIHRIAFKDHFNSRMGNLYAKAFLGWFGENNDTIFIQAVESKTGKVLGYICGAKEGYGNRMTKHLLPVIIISFVIRPWIMLDKRFFGMIIPKLKVIFSVKPDILDEYPKELRPAFSAVSLATDPTASKSYCLSEKLYDDFLEKVKKLGMKSVKGTVLKKNKLALVYYIHNKWSILKRDQNNSETITIYKKL